MELAQVNHRRPLISVRWVTLFPVDRRRSARTDRYVIAAVGRGRSVVGQSEYRRHCLTGDRRWRWRGHTHGAHWCNQEQSCRLTVNPISLIWSSNRGGRDTDRARTVAERLLIFHSLKGLPTREFLRCVTTAFKP